MESQTLGNGLVHRVSYNARLQPTTIGLAPTGKAADMFRLDYSYGKRTGDKQYDAKRNNGNIGMITLTPGSSASPLVQQYDYDELNRLTFGKETYQGAAPTPSLTAISPPEGQQGTTFQVTLTGENLTNTQLLNFTPNNGITVSGLSSTATSITATFTIAPDAALGPRTITATTPLGVTNGVTFTVTQGSGGGCTPGEITLLGEAGDAHACIPTKSTAGQYVCFAVSGALPSGAGSVSFDVDLTGVSPSQQVTISTAYSMFTIMRPRTTAQVQFVFSVAGGGTVTQELHAAMDANGVITSNGGPFPGGTALGGTAVLSVAGGSHVTVTYGLSGMVTREVPGSEYPEADFSYGGPLTAETSCGRITAATHSPGGPEIPGSSGNQKQLSIRTSQLSTPKAETTSWEVNYSYDQYGNRRDLPIDQTTNRLNGPGYSYDGAGNLKTAPGGWLYEYDAENRLLSAEQAGLKAGVRVEFTYDGDGRRVKKVVRRNGTPSVTRFIYGLGGQLVAEYEGDTVTLTAPTQENAYGPTGMLAVIEGTETKYTTPDHLGSPRIITDKIGNVVSRRDNLPFGEDVGAGVGGRTGAMGYGVADKIRQRFTEYDFDEETGLDYAVARYFSPSLGRFISADPIAGRIIKPQSLNRFTYCVNNPLKYIDPLGLATSTSGEGDDEPDNDALEALKRGGKRGVKRGVQGIVNTLIHKNTITNVLNIQQNYEEGQETARDLADITIQVIDDPVGVIGGVLDILSSTTTAERIEEITAATVQTLTEEAITRGATRAGSYITREARWLELANQPNTRLPKEVVDHVNRHGGTGVQERFGLELAHPPKRSNVQGYDYSEAVPKTSADHRGIQHRYLLERSTGTTIRRPRRATGRGPLSVPRPGRLPR